MKKLAANLALAAASLAVCCVALEAAARVVVHRWRSQPGAIRDPLLRYHPTLGWDKPPGAEGWIRRPEYNVHLEINARGLRGPNPRVREAARRPPHASPRRFLHRGLHRCRGRDGAGAA